MENSLQQTKKIGIIVDSASFHNLMRIIGIGKVNLKKLLEVISQEVSQTIQAPVIIDFAQYITAAENSNRFRKRVESAGFQFIPTDRCVKGSDDNQVDQCIVLSDPKSIAALIVVTADLLDYAKSLEAKRAQGVRIFVAAITEAESDGHFPLSLYSRQLLKENQYTLINLGNYKEALLITQWVDMGHPNAMRASIENEGKNMTEKAEVYSDAGHFNLYEWRDARCTYLYSQICIYASKQNLEGIQNASEEISFLLDLVRTTDILDKKIQKERDLNVVFHEKKRKPYQRVTMLERQERERKILFALRKYHFASSSMLIKEMPDIETRTLQRDLRNLTEKGLIESMGEASGARYMLVAREEEQACDQLIDISDAAKRLDVSEKWLYRHWNEYPFSRKLSNKQLRFSALGIDAWIQARNNV